MNAIRDRGDFTIRPYPAEEEMENLMSLSDLRGDQFLALT
jgi:hypothetical protein